MPMKCRHCGSESIYRSHRQGLKEGLWLRIILHAPYRCRECGDRFYGFRSRSERGGHDRSLAEYLGLRGREYSVRQWLITAAMTLIFLFISIIVLLRAIK